MSKETELLALAKKRQQWEVRKGHFNIGELHGGIYECDYVSPRSMAAHNIENGVLLVLQDWIDKDGLDNLSEEERQELAKLGYIPNKKTNLNIDYALINYLRRSQNCQISSQKDIYITNIYPFIKDGRISAKDYREAENSFLKPMISVLQPRLIICAGKEAAVGVCNCLEIFDHEAPRNHVGMPYQLNETITVRVQHPGWGMNGWEAVAKAWKALNT